MKKLSILFLALVATSALVAADFTVDGIAYNILGGDSVAVTYKSPKYSGSITIPATVTFSTTTYRVTSIGDSTFLTCYSLSSITIPNSVTSIGESAIESCSSLKSITIPNSVTSIGYAAFRGCTTLSSINIPNSVTIVGDFAFFYCISLTSVNIGNSVTSIGESAFGTCLSLTSINVDATNTHYISIDGVLFNYAKLTLMQYTVGNKRTSYTIPNGVTIIGGGAFTHCTALTSLTLPNSVTVIGESGLYGCTSLTSLTCYATTPPTYRVGCFDNIKTSIPIYVPKGSIEAYKSAYGWKDFTNIQAIGAETTIAPDSVIISPTNNSITITWPTNDSTFTYNLVVYDADSNIVCTVSFDANGTMTGITYPAPARGNYNVTAEEVAIGYRFTIIGLNPATNYTYEVIYKDEEGTITHTESGAFTTTGGTTAIDPLPDSPAGQFTKVIKGNHLLIFREGKVYSVTGCRL